MNRLWRILLLLLACVPLVAAQSTWQYGRIVDVSKSVNTRTKAWVVNTPITEDEITYTISVHVQDKIIVGTYELTPEESAPPEEWTTNYPLRVRLASGRLYLRALTGDLTLHVVRRKLAKLMTPLTAEEKKRLEQIEAPAGSLVGFSDDKAAGAIAAKPAESASPPAPVVLPATMGTVNVRSTPYLSEVFVDGDSMGYTPAKVSLPPGKHSFRVEKSGYKAWTKEIMITVGSELTLDANLEKK
jgi:PEGA domain-containing protein